MSVTFITDRTAQDVERVQYLKQRIIGGSASASEVAEWQAGCKGAFNYTDMNRIDEALNAVDPTFARKTWALGDIITQADFTRYEVEIFALRDRAYELGLQINDMLKARAFFRKANCRTYAYANYMEHYVEVLYGGIEE